MIATLIIISLNVVQVSAEICVGGALCPPPNACCQGGGCCSWGDNHEMQSVNYPYGGYYKLKIWDMWYFWILIILVIVSCFGGCGYWWRRQILVYTRSSPLYTSSFQHPTFRYHHRPPWSNNSNSTETSTGDEECHEIYSTGNSPYRVSPRSFCGMQYYPQRNITQPPPLYSEVTAKPDLYPVIEESARDVVKTPTSLDSMLITNRVSNFGVVRTSSPSSSTHSTIQSSVFLPPPYSESDISGPYPSSYSASNISTPGSMISYSTNSEVIFLNSHVLSDSLPNSNSVIRPCLSPPLATSPTSEQIPSRTTFSPLMTRSNNEQSSTDAVLPLEKHSSPTSSLSLALSRLEQNVSAIIRHSETNEECASSVQNNNCSNDQVPSLCAADCVPTNANYITSSLVFHNRRGSLGSATSISRTDDSGSSQSRSFRHGRRGVLIRTMSDDPECVRIATSDREILIV